MLAVFRRGRAECSERPVRGQASSLGYGRLAFALDSTDFAGLAAWCTLAGIPMRTRRFSNLASARRNANCGCTARFAILGLRSSYAFSSQLSVSLLFPMPA